ncbi:hypothetical protein [Sphingorhabdus sp. Alg239-R122]|uniref:CBU_0592 family membrane protein n=1 Tax=Sphingorhabdus sp. Alg239-R122 TaxID=2305989 RepID=UPI0013D9E11D|nr:hypothetical protein [Sphingorhabdus sp. Alg239-R122]
METADIFGAIGSILILLAFAYVNVLKRAPDITFNVMNLLGAGGLAVSLYINYNLPVLLLEVTWMAIAIYGIVSLMIAQNRGSTA